MQRRKLSWLIAVAFALGSALDRTAGVGQARSVDKSLLFGYVVTVPASMDMLEAARESFRGFLLDVGAEPNERNEWTLVFTEAFANAVQHGSDGIDNAEVRVSWQVDGDEVVLRVTDAGTGPAPEHLGSTELPDDPLQPFGRGLFLIKEFVDEVRHWTAESHYTLEARRRSPASITPPHEREMNRALDEINQCYESLAAFYRLGEALIKSDTMAVFIERVISDIRMVVPVDHAYIVLSGHLQPILRNDIRQIEASSDKLMDSVFLKDALWDGREVIWESREEVAHDELLSSFGVGACLPIRPGNVLLGSLVLARSEISAAFNAGQINTMRTFADLMGIAISNANRQIARTREQRALRDLEIAASIQEDLLPAEEIPQDPAWKLFIERRSAREVAGDFVEAVMTDDGHLVMVIVDVMGKGVSAAFLAVMFRTALHMSLNTVSSVGDLVHALNRVLCEQMANMNSFATCTVAAVPPTRDRIRIVNAGHCPALLLHDGKVVAEVRPSGPPLGAFAETEYVMDGFGLRPGDGLLLVTDGLYEWEENERMRTWHDFRKFLDASEPLQPESLWQDVLTASQGAFGEEGPSDDQTILFFELSRNPKPPAS